MWAINLFCGHLTWFQPDVTIPIADNNIAYSSEVKSVSLSRFGVIS